MVKTGAGQSSLLPGYVVEEMLFGSSFELFAAESQNTPLPSPCPCPIEPLFLHTELDEGQKVRGLECRSVTNALKCLNSYDQVNEWTNYISSSP